MNPLFAVSLFAAMLSGVLLSNALPSLQRILATRWADSFHLAVFLLCGWYFDQLSAAGILLYAMLWITVYAVAWRSLPPGLPLGHVILAGLVSMIVLYVCYKADLVFHLQQGWLGNTSTFLFSIGEVVFLFLLVFFTWNTLYALSLHLVPASKKHSIPRLERKPYVSIHVPISSEPVEVVSQTLGCLAQLSYPAYEVIVIDNNTCDPALWMPVEKLCRQLNFRFLHVDVLHGYKAGALNLALAHTSTAAELIAVVDADYELLPCFLNETVAAFEDAEVAFLQTSQRNRNAQVNLITRAFNPVYDFFYDITMLARSRRNSSIFAGSAGLIRRSALQQAGGWAEWTITEDAELSLRLLALGHKGVYVNQSYGSGLMPETFGDVQKQWFRYFFGGLEITRRHLRSTILARNPLSVMQRLDFLIGGLIVLGAGVMLVSSVGIILTATVYSAYHTSRPEAAGDMFHLLTVFSDWLLIYNMFQAFGVFLLFIVFRSLYKFHPLQALGSAFSFQSLVTTQAKAAFSLIGGQRKGFVRTPKQRTDPASMVRRGSFLPELALCAAIGISMVVLSISVSSSALIVGYLSLGLWQMMIYGSTVFRALQPPHG